MRHAFDFRRNFVEHTECMDHRFKIELGFIHLWGKHGFNSITPTEVVMHGRGGELVRV